MVLNSPSNWVDCEYVCDQIKKLQTQKHIKEEENNNKNEYTHINQEKTKSNPLISSWMER